MADDLLQQGIAALQAGARAQARQLFSQAIRQNPDDERAWLWLSGAVETAQDKLMCLNKVLAINPTNEAAQRGIAALQKSSATPAPAPLSPLETPVPQHIRPSVVQAVLGTSSTAAEEVPSLTSTETITAANPSAQGSGSLDHTRTFDQLDPEEQRALEGYTSLIAHELAEGDVSQKEIVERLTKRGFSRTAVEQHVEKVAKATKHIRRAGKKSMPFWAWLFVAACGIMVIVPGGLIAGAFGGGGAAGCAAVARQSSMPTAIRIITCIGITIACWVAWAAISGILFTIL
ncbi:MAG: tetratricopeptide repeat protein [Anaerolineae bacterium]|nr:tetratricopeptide repeat protein [Anaerolineae bacterium]